MRAALALFTGTAALLLLASAYSQGAAPLSAPATRAHGPSRAGGSGTGAGASGTRTLQASPHAAAGGRLLSAPNTPDKTPEPQEPGAPTGYTPRSAALIAQGRTLYRESCSACHGINLEGRRDIAPALQGVGAGPPRFYLSTGRMPLTEPRVEPLREPKHFSPAQIDALVAYVASYGGPPAPIAEPSKGSLQTGLHEFTLHCAGCHQVVARGGLTVGSAVPDLQDATANQIAEAVRMGPYLMPHFSAKDIDQHELDSIARYVLWTRHPSNEGGWGIYNLGPIPEGMVAWFLLLATLVLVARLIGERTA